MQINRFSFVVFYFLHYLLSACAEVISQEKTLHNIEGFDKQQLKHAQTEVKNPLPDQKSEFDWCYQGFMELGVSQYIQVQVYTSIK